MMRRKNLERAVVLGLLLSTSVYGNAWAVEIGALDATESDKVYTTEAEYTITTTGSTNGIAVGGGHKVIIGSEQNNNVNTVTINAGGSGLIARKDGGTVTINANDEISITGNITYAGALSAGYAGTEYSLNSAKISISGNNGGAVVVGTPDVTDVKISITAKGNDDTEIDDVVNNITSNSASGTINLAAGELKITAERGSNNIKSTASSGVGISTSSTGVVNIIADNGKNIVSGNSKAIAAQGKSIALTAISNEITSNAICISATKSDDTSV